MPELLSVGALVFILLIVGLTILGRLATVTVYEWQRGLRFRNGKFDALVDPGRYRIWRPTTTIRPVDVRAGLILVSGQELVTADGVTVKISLAVQQRLADPVKAVLEVVDYDEATRSIIQIALREVVAAMTGDEVLAKRSEIGAQVLERSVEKVAALGVELTAVDVRDLMLPAATKRLYAQIVEARQRGLAALEQARGETAALRSLANAANLVEKSPTLFQLRLLQQMESSSGNTFVVGTPASITPVSAPPPAEHRARRMKLQAPLDHPARYGDPPHAPGRRIPEDAVQEEDRVTHLSKRIGALALAGMLLAACGGGAATSAPTSGTATGPATTSGPKPTSLTVLCTPQEDWCQAMTKAFQDETGITTTYVRLSSGEALAKLRATKSAPEFSVWWGGPADGFVAANAEGLLEAYVSPNAAKIPADQKDASGVWTGVYVGALGFCSNTKVLGELGVAPPDSWDDLLDPKLKGQVAVAHPASSGTAYTAFYTQVLRLGGEEQAMAYMKKLHVNILQYTKSGSAPAQMAGRGEIAVSIVFSHDCVKNIEAGFPDLVVGFPTEGTGYEIGGAALIANAPEKEAAKMWIDWSLTAKAQEIGATVASYQLPTNPDAAISSKSVKLSDVKLVDYDFDAAGAARANLTKRFEDEIAAQPAE